VDFSVAYFDSAPAVLAPADGGDIHDLATARDRRWAVQRATTAAALVDEVIRPDERVLAVDGEDEAVDAVLDGDAEAALLDLPAALVIADREPTVEVHARFDQPEPYGVVLPEDSPDINRVRYTYALGVLLGGATLAESLGIEAIVGAFFTGLALNRHVPNEGEFMEHIEFFGSALVVAAADVERGLLDALGGVEAIGADGPGWVATEAQPTDEVVVPGGRSDNAVTSRTAKVAADRGATVVAVVSSESIGVSVDAVDTLGVVPVS
jgi:hypothetical protein